MTNQEKIKKKKKKQKKNDKKSRKSISVTTSVASIAATSNSIINNTSPIDVPSTESSNLESINETKKSKPILTESKTKSSFPFNSNSNPSTQNSSSSSSSSFSSWTKAFKAASSITPHDLGPDYNESSNITNSLVSKFVSEWSDTHQTTPAKTTIPTTTTTSSSTSTKNVNENVIQTHGRKRKLSTSEEEEDDKDTNESTKVNQDSGTVTTTNTTSPPQEEQPRKKKKKKKHKKKKSKDTNKQNKSYSNTTNNHEEEEEKGDNTTNLNHSFDTLTNDDIEKQQQKQEEQEEENDDDDNQELQGQMLTHNGESIMVLINASKKMVYSAMDRKDNGDLIPIGNVDSDGKVKITQETSNMNDGGRDDQETTNTTDAEFPYEVDADDHCESPSDSYQDILPLLQKLSKSKDPNATNNHHLQIYDPYYCNGSVKKHLATLGFTNVYNEKQDCYAHWQSIPHDVLVTNPPYSGDHMERLMNHVTSDDFVKKERAWCLLMPSFVHKKEYYKERVLNNNSTTAAANNSTKGTRSENQKKSNGTRSTLHKEVGQPFYIVPSKRYVYKPPKGFRAKKDSKTEKKNSPFPSMWYIWGGTKRKTEELIQFWNESQHHAKSKCHLARSKSQLRDLRRKHSTMM